MYEEVTVEKALKMKNAIFIDVRSEAEYQETTIPGSVNIPVLNNQEKALVSSTYRNEGPVLARDTAMKLVLPNLPEKTESIDAFAYGKKVIIFCWRGGQRSHFMSCILNSAGYSVYRLIGGYKAYRRHVINYLNRPGLTQKAVVLYGLTGTGKTEALRLLRKEGVPVLDLEDLAQHRGSVFGKIGMSGSPTQAYFENMIFKELTIFEQENYFVVECESRRMGRLLLPRILVDAMKAGFRILLYTSISNRMDRLIRVYSKNSVVDYDKIIEATSFLTIRLGHRTVENLKHLIRDDNIDKFLKVILETYYDPLYKYPDRQDENYHLSVDSSNIDLAAKKIYRCLPLIARDKYSGGVFSGNWQKT